MVFGYVYVDMVMKDKSAVHVLMGFTSKVLIIFSLHAQVSLLRITFLVLLQLLPKLLHRCGINLFGNYISGNSVDAFCKHGK